jgi:hypothetical protein
MVQDGQYYRPLCAKWEAGWGIELKKTYNASSNSTVLHIF